MTKISALTALAGGSVDTANDLLAIVDTSATQTKKITVADLIGLVTDITGLLDFKGSTDCSANPNYPAASKGDFYLVSVAGKIGGASGIVVTAGDSYFATADNAGGTQAGVGTSWTVIQGNINFTPVNIAGDTMTGDLIVPDEAYDATNWNGNLEVPTKNAVRDKIESMSGSFTAASTTEVLTGTDSAKGGTPDSIAALWEQGSDVASAGTISLNEGGYFNITGTTTITDIDFTTDKAGRKAWVKFAGALTLTNGASLILPTGANITTAAGDTACFVSEGSDVVRCVAYQRASGAALTSSGGGVSSGTSNPGSPSTGDLFFRTDLKLMIVYDGTRWVTANLSTASFAVAAAAATFVSPLPIPFVDTYDVYLETATVVSQITSGTTGTNYFSWQFATVNGTNTVTNFGSAQSAQSDTQNNLVRRSQSINSVIDMTSAEKRITCVFTRAASGTGNFEISISYRLIVT